MKMKIVAFIAVLLSYGAVFSQIQGNGGLPVSRKLKSLTEAQTVRFAEPNIEVLRAEDAIVDAAKTGPWRFGFNNETNITLANSGIWEELPNGGKVWRTKIVCQNALTVNLTMENVKIPAGNGLYVYNEDKSFILGEFVDNHLYLGNLGTELIPGNTAIVEYYVAPNNAQSDASMTIAVVTHGYRTAAEFSAKALGDSGSCNMNVNCPDGAPWADQIRAAVMLVSGSNGFCSGSLINNTQNDGKPYVLTANHCYSNPASWIFRFNWQASGCTNPASSPTFQSLSGAVLRSRRTPSDFCLVEITGGLSAGTVPASYNPFFAGWDNTGTIPTSTVCIHHPSGDIKKISFDDAAASISQEMGSSEAQSTWTVEWDRNTTTEGGSSGSPLFDQSGRIIGQLWGGGASCSNLSAPDYYGRLSKSWAPASSTSANQLKFWLDPNSTNVGTLDSYDPTNPPAPDNAGINGITSPSGSYCGTTSFIPTFVLRNYGNNTLTSVTITYSLNGGAPSTYNWTGSLAVGANTTITLPSMTAVSGTNTFTVSTSMPNGVADTGTNNDAATSTFTVTTTGQPVTLALTTDCYGDETSWQLLNSSNVVVASAPVNSLPDETLIEYDWCLTSGCYTFVINDSYGDGLTATSCDPDGTYSISNSWGIMTSILQANFGNSESNPFCVITGIDDKSEFDFAVYPNPSNGTLTLQFKGSVGEYEITVVDLQGREIYSATTASPTSTHALPNVSNGTYLLKVANATFSKTQSIVISK